MEFALAGRASVRVRLSDYLPFYRHGRGVVFSRPAAESVGRLFAVPRTGPSLCFDPIRPLPHSSCAGSELAHPAARGSSIAIYATGAGLLSPSVADGTIV